MGSLDIATYQTNKLWTSWLQGRRLSKFLTLQVYANSWLQGRAQLNRICAVYVTYYVYRKDNYVHTFENDLANKM